MSSFCRRPLALRVRIKQHRGVLGAQVAHPHLPRSYGAVEKKARAAWLNKVRASSVMVCSLGSVHRRPKRWSYSRCMSCSSSRAPWVDDHYFDDKVNHHTSTMRVIQSRRGRRRRDRVNCGAASTPTSACSRFQVRAFGRLQVKARSGNLVDPHPQSRCFHLQSPTS